jgi:hypothetical protein
MPVHPSNTDYVDPHNMRKLVSLPHNMPLIHMTWLQQILESIGLHSVQSLIKACYATRRKTLYQELKAHRCHC